MLLYNQNGRVSIVFMEEILLFKVVGLMLHLASKTAVTNTYHWSNLGNLDCR